MTELQQLYDLRYALMECENLKKARANFDQDVERRLKQTQEAKEYSNAYNKLGNVIVVNYKQKKKIFNIAAIIAGIIAIGVLIVLTLIQWKQNATVKYPDWTDYWTEMDSYGYLFTGAIYGALLLSLTVFIVEAFSEYDELDLIGKVWLVTAGVLWISLFICSLVVAEGWDKIMGLFYPIFILLMTPIQLLQCLFGWEWGPLTSGVSFACAFNLLWKGILVSALLFGILKLIEHQIKRMKAKNKWEIEYAETVWSKACDAYENKKAEIENLLNKELDAQEAKLNAPRAAKDIIQQSKVVPDEDKVIVKVNRIIWCFEQKYAKSVIEAKQWLARMEHDQEVQRRLNKIDIGVKEAKEKAQEAVKQAQVAAGYAQIAAAAAQAAYASAKEANDKIDAGFEVEIKTK